MKARQQFAKLGYTFIDDKDYYIYINESQRIGIDFKLKMSTCTIHLQDVNLIDDKLKKAIKTQLEEIKGENEK